MELISRKTKTVFKSSDQYGTFEISVVGKCTQLQVSTRNGDEECFMDTNPREVEAIRDMLTEALRRQLDKTNPCPIDQPEFMSERGFTQREEWTEKDLPTDAFDTLKYVEYTRTLSSDIHINIDFEYTASEPGKFDLQQVTAELCFNDEARVSLRPDFELIENLSAALLLT